MAVSGVIAGLLWTIHIGLNLLGAREQRRAELAADRLAAKAAGSQAAMGSMEVMAGVEILEPYLDVRPQSGQAATAWARTMREARKRAGHRLTELRTRSSRMEASLFASHPPPGTRHDSLAGLPHQEPEVTLNAPGVDAELASIAEHMLEQRNEAARYWD